ncbi:uncharacterized protein LOC110428437 [Herrania umbratica]|uniref:Uncharacterized protein LOC110428437 n=1 Tax=Herrania umbratica TaxID=108875 RepID=A0A6J1BK43_9ROSI|nr:uncharacterized protein LOC110428437 [Herrania umbratica]
MTTNMGPPPPRNPNVSTEPELITQEESEPTTVKTSRDPPQKPPDQEKESTSLLAWNQSREFVYIYYVLRTISYIISQGSIFCIAVAYAADVVSVSNRAAVFSWITGLFSASHVLGNMLARFLPEKYIFLVSIVLLIFCPVYMQFFLVETVDIDTTREQDTGCLTKSMMVLNKRYKAMKDAAEIVISSPTLQGISFISFFYELGMSGITSILLVSFLSIYNIKHSDYCCYIHHF